MRKMSGTPLFLTIQKFEMVKNLIQIFDNKTSQELTTEKVAMMLSKKDLSYQIANDEACLAYYLKWEWEDPPDLIITLPKEHRAITFPILWK